MPLAIAKTLLPDTATFYLALGRVFGLGKATGLAIAEEVGVSKEARVMDVKSSHVRQVCVPCLCGVRKSRLLPHTSPPTSPSPNPNRRPAQVMAIINGRYKIGDELKRAIRDDILRLIEAKTYKGKRHELGLPVHGQRTHTNAQTARKFKRHIMYDVK